MNYLTALDLSNLSDQKYTELIGPLPNSQEDNDRDAFRHAFSAAYMSLHSVPIFGHFTGGNFDVSYIMLSRNVVFDYDQC
jgi:hypothetical protein